MWARIARGRTHGFASFVANIIVFVVALVSRLYGLESRSIWMDEDTQARRVLDAGWSLHLVERAATQQQPPIDYFAQFIGMQLFGVTPFGARVHAAVFGALTVLFIYRLARRIFSDWVPVIFATVLALLHPMLIFYSQEGRPIACGVFFGTLFLSNLHGFMLLPGARRHRALRGLGLLASTCAFLLSIGMQPSVLLAATSLALAPALFSRALRLRVLGAGAIFMAAFALAWPLLSRVVAQSGKYLQQGATGDRVMRVVVDMARPPFAAWRADLGTLLDPLGPPVIVLVVLGLWGFAWDIRRGNGSALGALTIFAGLTTLMFPWLLDAIFSALVKWPLKPRYYATLVPVVLMLLALLLHYAISVVAELARRSRAAKLVAVSCAVALLGWSTKVHADATLEGYQKEKQDWASLYALFTRDQPKGVSYIVNLRKLADRERGYYARRFYYGPSHQRLVRLSTVDELRRDFKGKRDLLVRGKVYIPVIVGWEKIRPLKGAIMKRVPGATFHPFHRISVIELRPTKHGKKALRQLFEVLVERLKPTPEHWRLYHTLAWLRFEDGDPKGAKQVAERLKKVASAGVVREANAILREIKYRQNYAKNQRENAATK